MKNNDIMSSDLLGKTVLVVLSLSTVTTLGVAQMASGSYPQLANETTGGSSPTEPTQSVNTSADNTVWHDLLTELV